ncbi:MAG: DUF1365 domain-containing protein [Rhodospirillales bacterium]|nr:MAG: DUF1365 domain-containing protein [Rhodospirillales bacterium]
MTIRSAIYRGTVGHERVRPRHHRLRYEVFSLLLDLDELPKLDRRLRLFGYNRRAVMSFNDRDHGPTDGQPLRPWVEARLRDAGIAGDGGPIRLLCYPRVLGYVFNPLSVYFCYRRTGELAAILYEVCNTYSERHTYVIPVSDGGRAVVRQSCGKSLYVSPFIGMDAEYHFRIVPPGDAVNVVIRQEDAEGLLLAAYFKGTREPLSDGTLARAFLRFPFLTVKIIAAIHWQALLLWAKGFRVFSHTPAAAPVQSSVAESQSHRV